VNVIRVQKDLIQILDQRIVQIALLAHALQVVMGKDVEIVHRGASPVARVSANVLSVPCLSISQRQLHPIASIVQASDNPHSFYLLMATPLSLSYWRFKALCQWSSVVANLVSSCSMVCVLRAELVSKRGSSAPGV